MKTNHKILILIILVAAIVRLPNINVYFSGDEIDTVGPARNFITSGETYQFLNCSGDPYFNNTHPPLRVVFYSMWAVLFGFSNIAMRIVPLLFGLATIILTYLIGKRLYSEKAGLAAAFIMAVSRYHIYASQLLSNDNTLFIFVFELAVYFFLLYKNTSAKKFMLLAGIFIFTALMAKLTFLILVPSMVLYSYLFDRKKILRDLAFIVISCAVFFVALYGIFMASGDYSIFSDPLRIFTNTAGTSSTVDFSAKLFYLGTVTWQLTPFLSLLIVLVLATTKKDKKYWFLASWIVLPFLVFIAGSGDVQRYYMISLPAVFILLGRFFEKFVCDKYLAASGILVFLLAVLLGLNDLMGYYNAMYLLVFYAIAVLFLVHNKRRTLLMGGAIGLSLFFAFSPGFVLSIDGTAVEKMVAGANELDADYTSMVTTKDINFYLTPADSPTKICEFGMSDQKDFDYFVFYHLQDESVVNKLSDVCENKNFVELNGRNIGIVCKTKSG